jgi:LDH2 family malate/lactate/ureidoglycolate dehydrogenase
MSAEVGPLAARLREAAGGERISADRFTTLLVDTFRHAGLSPPDAEIAAEVAAYGTLHGSDAHGAVQMPLYVTGLLDGTIKHTPRITETRSLPCCLVTDADHGLGLVVGRRAIDAAIDLARMHGLGAVAVRNSSHFGGAGYYSDRAARQRLIGFAFTNASPAIAPTGSKEALLGTNPIGVAFPLPGDDPIVIDMATSVVARSRIRSMLALGQKSIPDGWALDPDGKPTVDPAVAVKGSLMPIGGPKGYALALMVELLCSALSDGEPGFQVTYENVVKRPSTISQFFLVINPEGFAGFEPFGRRARDIADRVRNAKPIEGASPPRLPGTRGHALDRKSRTEGLLMFDNLRHALRTVAELLERHPASVRAG